MKWIVSNNTVSELFTPLSIEDSLTLINQNNLIGIDTETLGLDCHSDQLTLLQIGLPKDQIIIDCTSIDIQNYKEILESENILKIGANLKFDLQFLYKQNIWCQNIWDILLAEFVLYNGLNEKRLADIYNKYCNKISADYSTRKKFLNKAKNGWYSLLALVMEYENIALDKSVRENFNNYLSEQFLLYSAEDVQYLINIYLKQLESIQQDGCLKAVQLENKFTEALSYIEFCGLGINQTKWMQMYVENTIKCAEALHRLNDFIYENNITEFQDTQLSLFDNEIKKVTINWNSQKQLVKLLNLLGVKTVDEDGKTSVDAKVLEKQKDNCPLIPLLLEYNNYEKLASTYGKDFLKFVNPSTGRIHCNYTQLVSTSRLSSSSPNLQNIPATANFREAFEAKPGNLFCSSDYTAQESLCLVNYSKEPKLIDFYQNGAGDLHSYVAKLTFPKEIGDTPIEEIKSKFKKLRGIAKSVEFAAAYGGTGFTIAKNINVTPEEGDRIYNQYMKAFSGLKNYFEQVGRETRIRGYILVSPITNRKYHIAELKDRDNLYDDRENQKLMSKIQRLSQNYPIQGSCAEITKLAIIWFFKWIKDNKLLNKVLITGAVHDEILVEFPQELSNVPEVLKNCMEKGANPYCPIIKMHAVPETGKFWIH